MANNVKKEFELYEPMRSWLQQYLENKYKGSQVITIDSHAKTLDTYLAEYNISDQYSQAIGLDIQIDVLGIVIKRGYAKIVFIEAKKTPLNLHDLGQLWAYCKLCDPIEAFLLSSDGLGSLDKIMNNLKRTDLLEFGSKKTFKNMKICKWSIDSKSPDFKYLIPKD